MFNRSPLLKDIRRFRKKFLKEATKLKKNKTKGAIEPLPLLQNLFGAEVLFSEWHTQALTLRNDAKAKLFGNRRANSKRLVKRISSQIFLLGERPDFDATKTAIEHYTVDIEKANHKKILKVQLRAANMLIQQYVVALEILQDTRFEETVTYNRLEMNASVHLRFRLVLQTYLASL